MLILKVQESVNILWHIVRSGVFDKIHFPSPNPFYSYLCFVLVLFSCPSFLLSLCPFHLLPLLLLSPLGNTTTLAPAFPPRDPYSSTMRTWTTSATTASWPVPMSTHTTSHQIILITQTTSIICWTAVILTPTPYSTAWTAWSWLAWPNLSTQP